MLYYSKIIVFRIVFNGIESGIVKGIEFFDSGILEYNFLVIRYD